LSAALCCYLVLGKVQSPMQVLALGLLSLTPIVFQGTFQQFLDRNKKRNRDANEKVAKVDLKKTSFWGIVPCLSATLLSGLAGSFSQRSLQRVVGSMERNAYFYSAEISFFTAVCLLISMGSERLKSKGNQGVAVKENASGIKKGGYFDYWSWQTFIPITVKATGGILTALVHKHSGSVMKGFSLVLGLVFSALLQTVLDGEDLTMGQIAGTALVLLSSWLHFTSPP